jgi:hypothetical protein
VPFIMSATDRDNEMGWDNTDPNYYVETRNASTIPIDAREHGDVFSIVGRDGVHLPHTSLYHHHFSSNFTGLST